MAADDIGKNEISTIREYVQRVEAGFEKINNKVEDGFNNTNRTLQVIREWQIRAEEQQKYFVTETVLNTRLAPIENKLQMLEQKQPSYLQSATIAEKIIVTIVGIGIAVLTAFLTSMLVKP